MDAIYGDYKNGNEEEDSDRTAHDCVNCRSNQIVFRYNVVYGFYICYQFIDKNS